MTRHVREEAVFPLVAAKHPQHGRRERVVIVVNQHAVRPERLDRFRKRHGGGEIPRLRQNRSAQGRFLQVEAFDVDTRRRLENVHGKLIDDFRATELMVIVNDQDS
ncbi:hypothetical protein [Paraburkholderia youngii]|uniref:hypothetical protein n=1 Tax=Paraburkholderia youngii TaxID=2782701 RepID=UPI0020CE0238|nr:hypothetical protein [Paraburkholderia youngii]